MLRLVAGDEPSGGTHDTPPRHALRAAPPQEVAHGPGRAGKAGLLGHLAVGDDVARLQPVEHGEHAVLERHGVMLPEDRHLDEDYGAWQAGRLSPMLLLSVPVALLAMAALLALASRLEQRRARVLVRMTIRSKASPEAAEALIAAELAPLLAAEGLTDRC